MRPSIRRSLLFSYPFVLLQIQQPIRVNAFLSQEVNYYCTKSSRSKIRKMVSSSSSTTAKRSSLVSPVVKEQRLIPVVPWPAFLAVTAFLPVWAVTVVPLSVVYQLGKAVLRLVLGKKEIQVMSSLDSGYVVDSSRIVPRQDRKYDVVLLGATGFCGRLAARYMAKTYGCGVMNNNDRGKARPVVKWAIAGRSKTKLEQVKKELAKELGIDELINVDVILVDTNVPATLPALVEQTRVVASTAGPYTLYGSHVCEFCAKFGTHYVDITGEVDWVKAMHVLWQKTAEKTGSKLISFCGHDSIPWDLSFMKLQEALKQECNDELESVTFWDEAVAGAPGGTFETVLTALDGIKPPPVPFNPFARKADGTESSYTMKSLLPFLPAKANSPWDDAASPSSRWQSPFIMAYINIEICRWSHALRSSGSVKSISYCESMVCPDFKSAFVMYVGSFVLLSLFANPLSRPLLRSFLPRPGEGPDQVDMETKHFLCVYGLGVGTQGNKVESYMYFPRDPGCMETVRMMVESGLCLALEEDQLPTAYHGGGGGGGFYTPSVALGEVLMQRLLKTGTTYESRVIVRNIN